MPYAVREANPQATKSKQQILFEAELFFFLFDSMCSAYVFVCVWAKTRICLLKNRSACTDIVNFLWCIGGKAARLVLAALETRRVRTTETMRTGYTFVLYIFIHTILNFFFQPNFFFVFFVLYVTCSRIRYFLGIHWHCCFLSTIRNICRLPAMILEELFVIISISLLINKFSP